MAPRKNDESKTPVSTKKSQEKKTAKPKVKQLMPKLKPLVIKLNMPPEISNNSTTTPKVAKMKKKEMSPKLTRKDLTVQKKLELANEVAAVQLGNKHIILETTPIVDPPKAKRGRKRKIQEPEPIAVVEASVCTSASKASDSEDAFEVTSRKRKFVRKNPKKTANTPEAVEPTKGKISLSLSPKKRIKQTKLTDAKSGITKTPVSAPLNTKIPLTTECKIRQKRQKPDTGKINTSDNPTTDNLQSPSILDEVEVNTLSAATESHNTTKGDLNVEACPIDSRKTSLTSECLSWTKDISSSSTTTCVTVCSTDIVRIDNKIPIIKLTPTVCHLKQDLNNTGANIESSSSDSSSSESEYSPKRKEQKDFTPEMESGSLNLSSSSRSPMVSPRPASSASNRSGQNSVDEEMTKITYCIDKLTSKLKHFDLEIINWIGYENEEVDNERMKIQENIFKMLKEESEVIKQCRLLKKILSDNVFEEDANVANEGNTKKVASVNSGDNTANDRSVMQITSERSDDESNFTSDRVRYIAFDQSCDDDDALSLFAESITGMESSRRNSSAASMCTVGDFEEHVPQALDKEKWEPAKKISYPPPSFVDIQNDVKMKTVCEKQNADSTSIYKESEQYKDKSVPYEKNIPPLLNVNTGMPKKGPCLMSYVFKPLTGVKSVVFRGVCFFNILSSCKNSNCRFPHVFPNYDDITDKLMRLSEEMFIQEYMLMRNWPILRRKYGMCFVHECVRRDLTRILVEMALDFVTKANVSCREDMILKVVVIECILLHLNNVDLEICEDLLMYKHQDDLLCEIFMQVISNTQNFSRFKPIFIKLTKFILKLERPFSLDVATQILERICILPSDPPLLAALLEITKNTDQAILKNSMLGHFENQLSVSSKEQYEELLQLKNASLNRPVLQNLYVSSPKAIPEVEPVIAKPLVSEREKRYTSPDTTNLDTMNKSTVEPIITRTIDFNRAKLFGCTIQRSFSNSNSSSNDSSEEFRPKVVAKPNFKLWRDRSIFNSMRGQSPRSHGTPRPLIKRHIHQHLNFGPNTPNFLRRPGPDFF